jgi:hypothetical protein
MLMEAFLALFDNSSFYYAASGVKRGLEGEREKLT